MCERIMRRINFKNKWKGFVKPEQTVLLLIIWVIVSSFLFGNLIYGQKNKPHNVKKSRVLSSKSLFEVKAVKTNLFSAKRGIKRQKITKKSSIKKEDKYRILGTVLIGKKFQAIVFYKETKKVKLFESGEKINRKITIKNIDRDFVIILKNGIEKKIWIFKKDVSLIKRK